MQCGGSSVCELHILPAGDMTSEPVRRSIWVLFNFRETVQFVWQAWRQNPIPYLLRWLGRLVGTFCQVGLFLWGSVDISVCSPCLPMSRAAEVVVEDLCSTFCRRSSDCPSWVSERAHDGVVVHEGELHHVWQPTMPGFQWME